MFTLKVMGHVEDNLFSRAVSSSSVPLPSLSSSVNMVPHMMDTLAFKDHDLVHRIKTIYFIVDVTYIDKSISGGVLPMPYDDGSTKHSEQEIIVPLRNIKKVCVSCLVIDCLY